jgi:hypothetical protein
MKLNQVSGSRRSEGLLDNISVSRFDVPASIRASSPLNELRNQKAVLYEKQG